MNNMIMCRHCNRWTLNDYYGFCGIGCCADFAFEHNLLFSEARMDVKDERIEELQEQLSEAESDASHYSDEANRCYGYEQKCEDLEHENGLLRRYGYAIKAMEAHKKMEIVEHKYLLEQQKTEELKEKIQRLAIACKKLREENKFLDDKYTRFEAMDFS